MEHMLTDRGMPEEAVEETLTAIEAIKGEKAKGAVEARLRAAFREMGYEDDGERKVRKVMGRLHDEVRRVLQEQETAIQTHAAMPILSTKTPPAMAQRSPSALVHGSRRYRQNSVSL